MKKFTKVIAVTLFVMALGLTSCTEQEVTNDDLLEDNETEEVDLTKVKRPGE